jgi:hypothetical protein
MNAEWYYGENGVQKGPVDVAFLVGMLREGRLDGDDLVWRAGMTEWVAIAKVPDLAGAIRPAPMTPPPVATQTPYPQAYPQPFPQGGPGYQQGATRPADGRAVASLVLGILSTLGCMFGPIGSILGIIAVVMGSKSSQTHSRGLALAGIVLGSIGAALGFLVTLALIASPRSH